MSGASLSVLLLGLVLGAASGWVAGYYRGRAASTMSELAQAHLAVDQAHLAGERVAGQYAVESLVMPLRTALERVQAQLEASERHRLAATAALDEHLVAMRSSALDLRSETAQLVTALRAPQIRGRWGELQLERVVEAAGMVDNVDYVTQPTLAGEDGLLRPDLIVRLIGGKQIVVDSKVAFAGYLEAMEARDPQLRDARLKAHARQLRNHIQSLGSKQYWSRLSPSPEFVVCFVPADAFLDAALRQDPGLLELGFELNVIVATPSTLVALLRTIGYAWRQQSLAENTVQIGVVGRELYHRLSTMTEHLDKLGRSLNSSVGAFNSAMGTYERRVLVSARRLSDLAVVDEVSSGELTAPDPVLMTTRSPGQHDLTG